MNHRKMRTTAYGVVLAGLLTGPNVSNGQNSFEMDDVARCEAAMASEPAVQDNNASCEEMVEDSRDRKPTVVQEVSIEAEEVDIVSTGQDENTGK